jgi:hypothetical protein
MVVYLKHRTTSCIFDAIQSKQIYDDEGNILQLKQRGLALSDRSAEYQSIVQKHQAVNILYCQRHYLWKKLSPEREFYHYKFIVLIFSTYPDNNPIF